MSPSQSEDSRTSTYPVPVKLEDLVTLARELKGRYEEWAGSHYRAYSGDDNASEDWSGLAAREQNCIRHMLAAIHTITEDLRNLDATLKDLFSASKEREEAERAKKAGTPPTTEPKKEPGEGPSDPLEGVGEWAGEAEADVSGLQIND